VGTAQERDDLRGKQKGKMGTGRTKNFVSKKNTGIVGRGEEKEPDGV